MKVSLKPSHWPWISIFEGSARRASDSDAQGTAETGDLSGSQVPGS